MTTVLINGIHGKMGTIAQTAIKQSDQLQLVGGCGSSDDLAKAIEQLKPDCVLELTRADCIYDNIKIIIDKKVNSVIGTSGLTNKQIKNINKECNDQGIGMIIAPNFSMGALLAMKFSEISASYFDHADIIETHHPDKIDKPSATAKTTAQKIQTIHQQQDKTDGVHIHSLRSPGFIAKQTVIFADKQQTLTISHNTNSRDAFIPGIQLACEKIKGLQHCVVGLESLMFDQ